MANNQGFDLDGMTVEELTALRDAAEAKRLDKLDAAREAVLDEARAKLAKLGLTLEESMRGRAGEGKRRASGGKVAMKYRSPKGEEWSGRGKSPQWIADAEKQGRSREEFAIKR